MTFNALVRLVFASPFIFLGLLLFTLAVVSMAFVDVITGKPHSKILFGW